MAAVENVRFGVGRTVLKCRAGTTRRDDVRASRHCRCRRRWQRQKSGLEGLLGCGGSRIRANQGPRHLRIEIGTKTSVLVRQNSSSTCEVKRSLGVHSDKRILIPHVLWACVQLHGQILVRLAVVDICPSSCVALRRTIDKGTEPAERPRSCRCLCRISTAGRSRTSAASREHQRLRRAHSAVTTIPLVKTREIRVNTIVMSQLLKTFRDSPRVLSKLANKGQVRTKTRFPCNETIQCTIVSYAWFQPWTPRQHMEFWLVACVCRVLN